MDLILTNNILYFLAAEVLKSVLQKLILMLSLNSEDLKMDLVVWVNFY